MKNRSRECVCVRGLLDAFADDELTRRERMQVLVHLARCLPCTEELLSIRAVSRMLSEMPAIRPEPELAVKVQQAIVAASVMQADAGVGAQVRKLRVWEFDLGNICGTRSWKYAAYMSAAAVFVLGFWTSWQTPDELMNLFKTARARSVLVSTDCYIASRRASTLPDNHTHNANSAATAPQLTDNDGVSSLTEAMGLQTDEDGLYAVEM